MTFDEIPSINWNYQENNNGNFAIMTENRKRSRDDEVCEFMPLSKRINNLHINNNIGNASGTQMQDPSHNIQAHHNIQANGMNEMNGMNGIQGNGHDSSSTENRQPSYDPGANCSQSIYFYDNKLLFELHLQRIQRSGQQFPF